MSRIYTDYINKTAITIPDKFIDVKTGESHPVSQKIQDQIEYHAANNTLMHLVFSALNSYLYPKKIQHGGTSEILSELIEIKKMINQVSFPMRHSNNIYPYQKQVTSGVDLQEIEDLLDSFGG